MVIATLVAYLQQYLLIIRKLKSEHDIWKASGVKLDLQVAEGALKSYRKCSLCHRQNQTDFVLRELFLKMTRKEFN